MTLTGRSWFKGARDITQGRERADLSKASAIEHPENVLEMITVQTPDKLWQFKAPDVLLGGEWWWKMRQASGIETKEADKGKGVALAQTEHAKKVVRRSVMSM